MEWNMRLCSTRDALTQTYVKPMVRVKLMRILPMMIPMYIPNLWSMEKLQILEVLSFRRER